ncbi:MAG: hypothetical protein RL758_612 [Pseudomonadota bacterium]|jgi:uncharacterized protein YycO
MRKFIDQFLLVLASVAIPLGFWVYRYLVSLLVAGMGVGIVYAIVSVVCPDLTHEPPAERYWVGAALLLAAMLFLWSLKETRRDNPYRRYVGLSGFVNKLIDRFIAWIGTIKYFTQPMGLVQDPGSYKIHGNEIRELIDKVLQPGDILLRGYDGYLDGIMIRLSGGGSSLSRHFSHAAYYAGDLIEARDKPIVARRLQVMNESGDWVEASEDQKDKVRNDPGYFESGRQRVIHAMTKGVFTEDILTFVRCDHLVVLRLPPTMSIGPGERQSFDPLIAQLAPDARQIQQKLLSGETVTREEVLERVHASALGKIGSCYNFQFNDGKKYNRFSCSEFVYYCFKSVHAYLGLHMVKHGFLGFLFVRESITPADIFDAAIQTKKLEVVWTSRSLQS